MEYCEVCGHITKVKYHVCSGPTSDMSDLTGLDFSSDTLLSLAWIGDAASTLFVREALLVGGIRCTNYFQEFTKGKAQALMLKNIIGQSFGDDLSSTLYEALYASDPVFRGRAETEILKYMRSWTTPLSPNKVFKPARCAEVIAQYTLLHYATTPIHFFSTGSDKAESLCALAQGELVCARLAQPGSGAFTSTVKVLEAYLKPTIKRERPRTGLAGFGWKRFGFRWRL